MSLDQRMESETTRRRIIDPYALPMRRSLRTASWAESHEPRAPTTKAVTTTRYPSRLRQGRILGQFSRPGIIERLPTIFKGHRYVAYDDALGGLVSDHEIRP